MAHFASNSQNTGYTLMHSLRLFFYAALLLTIPFFASAQPHYTSTNKGAIKCYEEATKYYDLYQNEKALAELDKAISKDPHFVEAYMLRANIYVDMRNPEKAISEFGKAIEIRPDFFPNNYFSMASMEMKLARYEDAKVHFERFLSFPGTQPALREMAELQVASCKFAIDAVKVPVLFNPENLGPAINSEYDEYFPTLTVDNKTMFYTRNRPDSRESKRFQEDFYISTWENDHWTNSVNGGPALNTAGNEGVPNISSDGKLLFFAACDRPEGKGSCDIYYSRLKKEGWTRPLNLGPPINTGAWESQPSFASDGRTLYFIRGRISRGGIREQDIYSSRINDEGRWSEPVKLSSLINTSEEEEFVFIHPDNQTLYFSSDGHPGMGGVDIYVSRKGSDGNWMQPQNLGYPINTSNDEKGLLVGPGGEKAYISSDRAGGSGGLDLYSFNLYEGARPKLISYVKGIVTDASTGMNLEAAYEIIELESGKTILSSSSEKGTGEFLACLTSGKDYGLNVSRNGYLFYSDHFSCTNPADIKIAYLLDIKLQPVSKGGKVVLKNVFFDTNLFELKTESFSELDKVVAFMKANASVTVEVSGHTDSTGDKKKNQVLSENRAKSVYDYMTSKGIPAGRLSYKGYGDLKPIAANDTEENRAQNRRTEFLITGN